MVEENKVKNEMQTLLKVGQSGQVRKHGRGTRIPDIEGDKMP